MIKHGEITEPLLKQFGNSGALALKNVSPQNARRISMLNEGGELATIGRTTEILDLVGNRGDAAMEFIWKNKGSLAVAASLTAFLANPEPFIDGTSDITKHVGASIARPLAIVILVIFSVVAGFAGLRYFLHRATRTGTTTGTPSAEEQNDAPKPTRI